MITSLRCIHGKVRTSTIELLRSLRKARNWGSVLSVLKPSIQRLSWFSDIGDLCNKDAVWFPGSLLTLHARRITLIFFFYFIFFNNEIVSIRPATSAYFDLWPISELCQDSTGNIQKSCSRNT